ncbi:MFS transporter [Bacillus sp. HSf4]|uniref:MFS transporter n=1 Tax=Bacillus sp. HSf4 TaxID=3035514 RepID=UPI002409F388|nr:MFS transporter [Bacillus sp. HSf4]WFA05666.1 MFS transporter [Bacillus sp. HSf4]
MPKTVTFIQNQSFLSLWLGQAVSELGGAIGALSNALLVFELTGSKLVMSGFWLVYFIPSLALQLVIGPFIDLWSRKKTMLFSQLTRAFAFLFPIAMMSLGKLEVWNLLLLQAVIGLIQPLYAPAGTALIPALVKEEQLIKANAYIDGTLRLMGFIAPPIGGLLAAWLGPENTLAAASFFFLLSAFLLLKLKEERIEQTGGGQSWLTQLSGGIRYFFTRRLLVWLGFFLAFVQFGVGVTMVLNVPYVLEELGGSELEYGCFMAAFPLGYFCGSIAAGRLGGLKNRRLMMLGALAAGGLSYIALGFVTEIWAAVMIEAAAGVTIPFFSVHNTSLYQKQVPQHFLGKVLSVRLFIIRGTMMIGVLFAGRFSEMLGIRPLFFMIGAIIFVTGSLGILLPCFRFLDDHSSPAPNTTDKAV